MLPSILGKLGHLLASESVTKHLGQTWSSSSIFGSFHVLSRHEHHGMTYDLISIFDLQTSSGALSTDSEKEKIDKNKLDL